MKKHTKKFYIFVTNKDGCVFDRWPDAQKMLDEFSGLHVGQRILGSVDTREEADTVLDEYLRTLRPALPPYFTGTLPGRVFDVYAAGVYEAGKFGGAFAVYEGSTLLHTGKLKNPSNQLKRSGKWAGLYHSIIQGTQWAKNNGADSVMVHTNTEGPAELIAGVHKAARETTQVFVDALAVFKGSLGFATIPKEADEGLIFVERLAKEAAGIIRET